VSDDLEPRWEAPPEQYITSKYHKPVEQVKERPGHWLLVKTTSSGSAYSARNHIKRLTERDRRYECIVRRIDETQYGLYLRYRTPEQMKE
jgi:hypothetical protein